MIKILPILLILSLLSCGSQDGQQTNNKDTSKIKNDSLIIAGSNYLKIAEDSVIIPPVEIEVSLSERANQKMKKDKETIIVAAFFSGQPRTLHLKCIYKMGKLMLPILKKNLATDG